MRTWRLVIFGREFMRTETVEDPDKTMVQAIHEMIQEEDDEAAFEDDLELRVAGEDEHVVFSVEDDED